MATPEWFSRLKHRTAEIIDFENDALERDMVRSQETPSEAQETEEDVARRLRVERERQEEEEIAARLREWNSRNVSKVSRGVYCVLCVLICVTMIALLMFTVTNLPSFGSPDHPINNEVSARYIEKGLQETGAVNTVAGMILDYRAFDTLGESFVLFTAMCAVTMLMNAPERRRVRNLDYEVLDYYQDPIIRTVCKFVIPIILVFGVYILLNGHLSPGGGFSGGAIMASALIIYGLVWGGERASKAIPAKVLKIIVLCALGFYACSKTYSFFTGANHLHSIISPGVPGRILSAGLILPLNVAVGFVVCCTMYSFYMYFQRGEL